MITLGKAGTLAAYRTALSYITKEGVAQKVFSTIAPSYANVSGGYTQIYKMGPRRGDGAEMAVVRLTPVAAAAEETASGKDEKK